MEDEENKTEKKESIRINKKSVKNYWMYSTAVLAVIAIIAIGVLVRGGVNITGNIVSEKDASEKLLTYLNSVTGGGVTLVDTKDAGSLYKMTVSYQGKDIPVYITKDGQFFVSNIVPLSKEINPTNANNGGQEQPTTEISKTDKPKVELFVMSHCPYGTQIEKGIIPVVKLLGNKIDFSVKFIYYAMHGEKEVKEQLNQYCIEKEQNDKYLQYLECFLKEGNGDGCLTDVGISKAKLSLCTQKTDKEFNITANLNNKATWLNGQFPRFDIYKTDNEKYQVGGSPTLIINSVNVSSGRDSASLLKTVCGAFTTQPAECKQTLSAQSPTPGFGDVADTAGHAPSDTTCG